METIFKGYGNELFFKSFVFSGGEVSVKLYAENYEFNLFNYPITILSKMASANDFMSVAMLHDAVVRLMPKKTKIHLFLPYVPYARQDRACVTGESFSLKVFATLLNALKFETVTVIDPHSNVLEACIDNVKVISQLQLIQKWEKFKNRVLQGVTFVSPDAGANKKTSELAAYFEHPEFIRADKLRDLANGKIKETIVYTDDLKGQDIVIADDICDGGRTFIELAKALKAKGAGKIILFVTHGIFSQGIVPLYEGGIDEIWTTNSFPSKTIEPEVESAFKDKKFFILPIEKYIQ